MRVLRPERPQTQGCMKPSARPAPPPNTKGLWLQGDARGGAGLGVGSGGEGVGVGSRVEAGLHKALRLEAGSTVTNQPPWKHHSPVYLKAAITRRGLHKAACKARPAPQHQGLVTPGRRARLTGGVGFGVGCQITRRGTHKASENIIASCMVLACAQMDWAGCARAVCVCVCVGA